MRVSEICVNQGLGVFVLFFCFSSVLFFLPADMPDFMLDAARFVPSKIVGGEDAPLPIPWQVSVQSNNIHFCGATILDQVTLLSAASCFYGNTYVDGISIRAGSIHKSDGQVCLSVFFQFLKHYILVKLRLLRYKVSPYHSELECNFCVGFLWEGLQVTHMVFAYHWTS